MMLRVPRVSVETIARPQNGAGCSQASDLPSRGQSRLLATISGSFQCYRVTQ
jgi:hypothetical protein